MALQQQRQMGLLPELPAIPLGLKQLCLLHSTQHKSWHSIHLLSVRYSGEKTLFKQSCRCALCFKVTHTNDLMVISELGKNLVENAKPAPAYEPVVQSFVWPIFTRSVFPLKAILYDVNNPAQHTLVINPRGTV